LNQRPSD